MAVPLITPQLQLVRCEFTNHVFQHCVMVRKNRSWLEKPECGLPYRYDGKQTNKQVEVHVLWREKKT